MLTLLNRIYSEPWVITPDGLSTIIHVATHHKTQDLEAIAAKNGIPLGNSRTAIVRNGVAIIPVTGPIFPRANFLTQMSGATDASIVARDFQAALDNPAVQSILLEIDSPGGTVAGTGDLADLIYGARGIKPIVAHVDGMAASAAYWIASAADELVISASAGAGSIGVVLATQVQEKPDMHGMVDVEITSGGAPNKRPDPRTDEGMAVLKNTVDQIETTFVAAVARNRGVTDSKVLADFGQGAVLFGAAAVQAGLADRIATFESVLAGLSHAHGSNQTVVAATAPAPATQSTGQVTTEEAGHMDPTTEGAVSAPQIDTKKLETDTLAAERQRVSDIDGIALAGHEDLITKCKADGTSVAETARLQAVAEKDTGVYADTKAAAKFVAGQLDGEASAAAIEAAANVLGDIDFTGLDVNDRCAEVFKRSPEIREEFKTAGGLPVYQAYERANADGRIRYMGEAPK